MIALLDRGRKAAQLESQREIAIGVQTIRQTQSGELAALRRDYDARVNRAASNYENSVGRVENIFDGRSAALGRQVRRLRKQKAEAKIQQEEIADLKAGNRRERAAIREGKQSATQSLQQNDAEAIVTLRNRGKRIYNTTGRTLQARRVNQLNDLERKLNVGRAAIARIPAKS